MLGAREQADIDLAVDRVLRQLGNPRPPLDLGTVRHQLRMTLTTFAVKNADIQSGADPILIVNDREISVSEEPDLRRLLQSRDAIKASGFYVPDQRKILLDQNQPVLKHRWTQAHEIGHAIVPWHAMYSYADTSSTLSLSCHTQLEAEANYAAGRLLFLGSTFTDEVVSLDLSWPQLVAARRRFGNSLRSTFWQYVSRILEPR